MIVHQTRTSRPSLAITALLVAAFTLLPLRTVFAASPAQGAPAELLPLMLGEYVAEELANGETRDYEISIPEDGTYETRIVDADDAIAFDLVVTDDAGNEIFNDIFGEIELELTAGDIILHFEAVDTAELAFAVVGNIGDMSEDIEQPGNLPTGGVYYNNSVSEPMYAIVPVPETDYPQQVTVYIEPGADDSFYVSAEGDDIGYLDTYAEGTDLLRFYTHGGDFLISVEPDERRSELTIVPFVSGAPEPLALEEAASGTIPAGEYAVIFGLQLETPFEELTIEVDTPGEDIDVTLLDKLYDGDYVESSFGDTTLTINDLTPGAYYVIVETFDELEEDLPVSVVVSGEAGDPIELLVGNETVDGLFDEGDLDATYFLDVAEPGSLVSVALASEVEESDFDLEAGINLDEAIWSTFTIGSDDKMSFLAPAAGRYYIRVVSNGGAGDFALTVEDKGIAPAITPNELVWGSVEEGDDIVYSLEIPEAGGLLSVALVGQEDLDLDLRLAGYDENGNTLAYASGYSISPAEIVSAPMEEPGIYEVVVSAEFSEGGNYVLLAQLVDPARMAGQWATEVVATSQYGEDGYSAMQASGAPDTLMAGDINTAWAAEQANTGEQTLELTYEHSVIPSAVNIHENYNPGAVIAVIAYDAQNEVWEVLWDGEAEAVEEPMRVFSPELGGADFATNLIRIVLDTDAVDGWNEIDAVELVGRP